MVKSKSVKTQVAKKGSSPSWVIGLDIGGTFTDVMMIDIVSGRSVRHKVLTTPADPSIGALDGVEGALRQGQVRHGDVAVLLHATTLVSNALIERKGAQTALVTTRGFKDVLEIAREKKFDIYDLLLDKPLPLVDAARRFEVAERLAADGTVLEPLSEAAIDAVIPALRRSGAQAIAVCLLHSYVNPAHERLLRERLQAELPDVSVCISSDILQEMREFERASTAVANAYVQPLTSRYLDRFAGGLRAAGLTCPVFIMLSEGAIAAPDLVMRMPIRICESGPAAGAVTSAAVARQLREPRILSFDMGGTTAKICVVHDGKPSVSTEFEVARIYRFKKGSGLPLRMPVIDLIEIGAGGGSLVHVDELQLLKVGPESAAADPGPACYGKGGQHPTVTDADLVLGYLGADTFLNGRMQLDAQAARRVIAADVAKPLKISVEQAALGIYEIVNENMANASRVQAVERGHDPSGHVLVAFGGAGPVHAWGVAQKLGVPKIIIPPSPGVGSAFGLLLAPRALQLARTYIGTLQVLDWKRVQTAFDEMAKEGVEALARAGVGANELRFTRRADMRYRGQRKEITVDLPGDRFDARRIETLREAFERSYEKIYHRRHEGHAIEVLCWRLAVSGPETMGLPVKPKPIRRTAKAIPLHTRPMLFPGWAKHRPCPVYSRYDLPAGVRLAGPAVVEEDESASVVGPGGSLEVDGFSNLVITLPKPRSQR